MRRTVKGVALSVAFITVASMTGCAMLDARPSFTASGTAIPFAGDVPWSSAVLEANGTTVHFEADWDSIHGAVCASPNERVSLHQTSSKVTITVLGYAKPLSAGMSCGSPGTSPQPETVTLSSPLGTRPLIDGSTGKKMIGLADTSVPTVYDIPTGYAAAPMAWENDTATRIWRHGTITSGLSIRLTAGVPTRFDGFVAPAGTRIGTTTINGATASEFQSISSTQVVTTIRWTTAGGRELALKAFGTVATHLSVATVGAIATSVR